jgi:hypothetical protein
LAQPKSQFLNHVWYKDLEENRIVLTHADSVSFPFDEHQKERLKKLSALNDEQRERLFEEILDPNKPIVILGALPFSEDFTFSLELQFLFNPVLHLEDSSLSDEERRKKLEQTLLYRFPMPPGWKIRAIHEVYCELNTASEGKIFHENRTEDWQCLKRDLDQVQNYLPAGFMKAHMHIGNKKSNGPNNKLIMDQRRFGRLVKVYEALWRALSGYDYTAYAFRKGVSSTFGLNFINTNDPNIFKEDKEGNPIDLGVYYHCAMINLSEKFPTMEIKILSGLLGSRTPLKHLNVDDLQEDLWWAFALMRCALDPHRKFPLATLGIPIVSGEKPSLKQVCHFLDTIYEEDLIGKVIALRRLIPIHAYPAGASSIQLAARKCEAAIIYERLGLGLVYELHEENEGWDEQVEEHILQSPELFRRLCDELQSACVKNPMEDYFANPHLLDKLNAAEILNASV